MRTLLQSGVDTRLPSELELKQSVPGSVRTTMSLGVGGAGSKGASTTAPCMLRRELNCALSTVPLSPPTSIRSPSLTEKSKADFPRGYGVTHALGTVTFA